MGTNTMKRFLPAILLLAAFVGLSLQFINEPLRTRRSDYRSNMLKQVVTKDGNVVRTDYIDDDGIPRIAANVGYATKISVQQGNSETETFFDDRGERISLYCGYYGILREYDEAGNNIRITYLNEKNEPVVMSLNYAVEERCFNEAGRLVSRRYLDTEGNPALSCENGFGARYRYDDKGRMVMVTYIGEKGEPVTLPYGYSTLVRRYSDTDSSGNRNGIKDLYYLPDGSPALLPLGQSGEYKEYDGNGLVLWMTYLDADGSPIVTNKGYTSVAYTYYANNSVQSTFYYDIHGNPFRMSEGQYGTKDENGQTVYLNADGTEQFNIKNYVYKHSGTVIIIAIILVLFSSFTGRKINCLMLAAYLGVIAYFTLMYRETGETRIGLFRSYRAVLFSAEARAGILKNIWLFVPLGAILYRIYPRKAVLSVPVLLSVIIEAVQLLSGTGICELSDVISNGLGGAIGYGAATLTQAIRKALNQKQLCVLNS